MSRKKLGWLLLCAVGILSFAAEKKLENFQPDLSTSDIYLPHLKRVPLGGWWKLKRIDTGRKNDPNDEGSKQIVFKPDYSDVSWERDLVPNNLNTPYLKEKLTQKDRSHGGVVWYRKKFSLPEYGKKERILLYLEDVVGAFRVYLNGEPVLEAPERHPLKYGAYRGPGLPFEVDVTKQAKAGENVLVVRLFHSGNPVYPWGGAVHGIMGRVYVDIKPAAWTDRILVTTKPDLKTIEVDCLLSGSRNPADLRAWKGEVFEWKSGKACAQVAFGSPYEREGVRFVSGKTTLRSPRLWSTEDPFLYGVRIRNAKGETVGVQRFGVRTFGVKNGNFVLNGVPVFLRGRCFNQTLLNPSRHGYVYALAMNVNGYGHKFFETFRNLNHNYLRLNSYALGRNMYEHLDELGIIASDELYYKSIRLEHSRRIDEIAKHSYRNVCDAKGNLLPEFQTYLRDRLFLTWSNPSLCLHSFGNEIRDFGYVSNMMNNIYDFFRKWEKQNLPQTPSSGRVYQEATNLDRIRGEKFDYIDTHAYAGTGNEYPLPYVGMMYRHFIRTAEDLFGKDRFPIVNGECVYDGNRYWKSWYDGIWNRYDDSEPNWDKYLACVNEMKQKDPEPANLSLYWIRNWGAKNYKFRRSEGFGIYTERVLEYARALWPKVDGYAALADPYISLPETLGDFSNIRIEYLAAAEGLRKICAPMVGGLEHVAPNQFAETALRTNAWVVNNHESPRSNVRMEVALVRDGKTVRRQELSFGEMKTGEKKTIPLSLDLPAEEGFYRLTWRVLSNAGVENERFAELKLRDGKNLFAPIRTKKNIALFDASNVFGSLKPYSTQKILKQLGIRAETIEEFRDLSRYDLLILGNNSVSASAVQTQGDAIRSYVENGGRLLVFDQEFSGRMPFLSELEYTIAGPGQFSEVLRFRHPAVKGMDQHDFFLWNSKDQCFYRTYILPVSRAAIAAGGNTAGWGVSQFGMVLAHLKLGKGDVLFSQAEVTENFRKDPAAARLCRNLLEMMLDDATRKNASEFQGFPPLRTTRIADADARPVSLAESANMGFADPVAGDGKGGWSDQGPENDLHPFPVGTQRFAGTLFRIVDPAKNGGRSCVVVAKNPDLKFKEVSRPIRLGFKASRLMFLHTTAWDDKNPVGAYRVEYESGNVLEIPLAFGENIGGWWNPSSQKLSSADCGWTVHDGKRLIGAFLFNWKNPRPQDPIRSVTLRSNGKTVIGLLGLTAERAR